MVRALMAARHHWHPGNQGLGLRLAPESWGLGLGAGAWGLVPPGGCTARCDGVGNVAGELVVAVLSHVQAVIQPGLAAGVVHGIEVKGTSLVVQRYEKQGGSNNRNNNRGSW